MPCQFPAIAARGEPPTGEPAPSLSTNLGFYGPEINKRAITAIATKAAIIGQLILLIMFSPGQKTVGAKNAPLMEALMVTCSLTLRG